MLDQRKHQRIRFSSLQRIRIGYDGAVGEGVIENLSLSGLMVRTPMPLTISHHIGCEFSLFGSPIIDVPAIVVSKVGEVFGIRFQLGPISEVLVDDAINGALADGRASILTLHEQTGRKIMRIVGGLCGGLRNDFMHALTRVGLDEIDLGGVTAVEQAGLALCLVAVNRHGVVLGEQSQCFAEAWRLALSLPGSIRPEERAA